MTINRVNRKKCSGCSACYNICPASAIEMQEDNEGFKYPIVTKEKCIDCDLCEKVCSCINHEVEVVKYERFLACTNLNESVLKRSSSGGIFFCLAKYIIEKGGIVFGAAFDESFNLRHIGVESWEEVINKLCGSKYLQSDIDNTYVQCRHELNLGRHVLFAGTPCQIAGLKKLLGKDYANLIAMDIFCHGVPSPLVWRKYLIKNFDISKIRKINFRDKTFGWKNYSFFVGMTDEEFSEIYRDNLYMNGFLANLFLRPSCYNCSFKGLTAYHSDITVGDFWGVERHYKDLENHLGVSIAIIHNPKLYSLLLSNENLNIHDIDKNNILSYNKEITRSSKYNHNRDSFFEQVLAGNDINAAIRDGIKKQSLLQKLKLLFCSK